VQKVCADETFEQYFCGALLIQGIIKDLQGPAPHKSSMRELQLNIKEKKQLAIHADNKKINILFTHLKCGSYFKLFKSF
jgi:hypothetical protein